MAKSHKSLLARFAKSILPQTAIEAEPEPEELEDGRKSLRSIRQYDSLKDIYRAFGEVLPADPAAAKADVTKRVERFQRFLSDLDINSNPFKSRKE